MLIFVQMLAQMKLEDVRLWVASAKTYCPRLASKSLMVLCLEEMSLKDLNVQCEMLDKLTIRNSQGSVTSWWTLTSQRCWWPMHIENNAKLQELASKFNSLTALTGIARRSSSCTPIKSLQTEFSKLLEPTKCYGSCVATSVPGSLLSKFIRRRLLS
jgi:hypothetical protein